MKYFVKVLCIVSALLLLSVGALAQLPDNTQATNNAKAGINKSLADEIGAGRGDVDTPGSSIFNIERDRFGAGASFSSENIPMPKDRVRMKAMAWAI